MSVTKFLLNQPRKQASNAARRRRIKADRKAARDREREEQQRQRAWGEYVARARAMHMARGLK